MTETLQDVLNELVDRACRTAAERRQYQKRLGRALWLERVEAAKTFEKEDT